MAKTRASTSASKASRNPSAPTSGQTASGKSAAGIKKNTKATVDKSKKKNAAGATQASVAGRSYRHIEEDDGGTYYFSPSTLSHIGTNGLYTCLGVYFAINHESCFFAHINVDLLSNNGEKNNNDINHYRTNDNLRATVIKVVREFLQDAWESAGWPAITDRMRDSVVLVKSTFGRKDQRYVADAAAMAVIQFLGIPRKQWPEVQEAWGFVVEHPWRSDSDVTLFKNKDEANAWVAVTEHSRSTEGKFGIEEIRRNGHVGNRDGSLKELVDGEWQDVMNSQ
jgi:hypothetical protein